MRGYLLDTNHVSALFDNNPAFISRLEKVPPDWFLWISAVSLGEIETSYLITNRDVNIVQKFQTFIRTTFLGSDGNMFALPIDENSRQHYAEVISRIVRKHPFGNPKQRTERHLVSLGVDVNDVWIFATAWKHNLILLTTDKMDTIRDCVPDTEVRVENWL